MQWRRCRARAPLTRPRRTFLLPRVRIVVWLAVDTFAIKQVGRNGRPSSMDDAHTLEKAEDDGGLAVAGRVLGKTLGVDERLTLLQRKPVFGKDAVQCWVAITAFASAMQYSSNVSGV